MREGKDAVASSTFNPIRLAAEARKAYTITSVWVSSMKMNRASANRAAVDRNDASRAEAKGAASTNSFRSH
eukprot:2600543-Pleurochrysis_carterae.AAC.3